MITLRVEVMRSSGVIEEEIEEPAGWNAMTTSQRDAWCEEAVADMRGNLVYTSYAYPGDEGDS